MDTAKGGVQVNVPSDSGAMDVLLRFPRVPSTGTGRALDPRHVASSPHPGVTALAGLASEAAAEAGVPDH